MTFFVTQLAITGKQLRERNQLSREFQWLLTIKYLTNRIGVLPVQNAAADLGIISVGI